jgi:large subunit ribosomal protein L25
VTRELEIECLPADIPDKVVVDVSHLTMGKHVRVSELTLSEKLKLKTGPDVVIAHVVLPRAEEEVAPAAVAAEGVVTAEGAVPAEPEVIKKGKTAVQGEAEEKPEKPEKAERAEKKEKK